VTKRRAPRSPAVEARRIKSAIDQVRAAGDVEIAGCSMCVRLTLKVGTPEAKPCPMCGAMVTTRSDGTEAPLPAVRP